MNIKRLVLALILVIVVAFGCLVGYGSLVLKREARAWTSSFPAPENNGNEAAIEKNFKILKTKMDALAPKGVYIMIDTAANRFFLRKESETIRQGVCSTGSGDVLPDPRKNTKTKDKQWIFDTPRGEFSVKSKIENPYWIKPDWAFIEEGEPIPKNQKERAVAGELGDYALGFGKEGYFLHGTLYTRLLGRSVTHGCVRFGDEDIKALFRSASIGTKIFIF